MEEGQFHRKSGSDLGQRNDRSKALTLPQRVVIQAGCVAALVRAKGKGLLGTGSHQLLWG